ncbi:MAG: hypothetical protein RMJ98_11675 [Myxococcales bacterium]|nr:hypothetical protein [Polyangiaceae bacterium]MDW8249947.1 hypothetical protein [Myxococcales bacterium]
MATPLTQSLQTELDAINGDYETHFAGQSRATRDLSLLDQLISKTKALLARIDAIPAAARGPDLTELRKTIEDQKKLFDSERIAIEKAKKMGPALEQFAPLATAANLTFSRYTRHFAGKGRDTRDLELLEDMIDELTQIEKQMSAVIQRSPSEEFRNDRNIVQQNLEMYKRELNLIRDAQTKGSPEARAERCATLANNQFELYRIHFAGQNRLTRRPQLLQRMIKSLERIQGIMKGVQQSGYAPEFNQGNIDIVEQNLQLYRSELAEIRKTKEQNSPETIAGNLGNDANQLFAEYRTHFAGKNRTTVDHNQLSSICDRLFEIYRQMRDLNRLNAGEMNAKNLEIVSDQLSMFCREYDMVVEAKKAAGALRSRRFSGPGLQPGSQYGGTERSRARYDCR